MFEGNPDHSLCNPIGSVHGGNAATLLDGACGIAVRSLRARQDYTTLEPKVAYHRSLFNQSGTVRTSGRVISMRRRVALTEARLHDTAGKLRAYATSTLPVFEPPH